MFDLLWNLFQGICIVGFALLCLATIITIIATSDNHELEDDEKTFVIIVVALWIGTLIAVAGYYYK
jgi:uncharacterized membrane protein